MNNTLSKINVLVHYNGDEIRLGHVLSCFFHGHVYEHLSQRDNYNEYACIHCGHPLLFKSSEDEFSNQNQFTKKVRYQCNFSKHLVKLVCFRNGFHEYACFCGHSFLKKQSDLEIIEHPQICTWIGHVVQEVCHRSGVFEYVCKNCGHTFCQKEKIQPKISKMFWLFREIFKQLQSSDFY